ncbi:peptidylprolyl isomerase [Roseivirga sp. E12]|uniref:peptidylprolyl isomerase n=1 Tax=Roseivirga sp. E12 TaxID=2819237 RepID=UPI001ABBF4A4|nr:peptidylprolyl isomerase [Roseivirga sp. E12]MBO3697619.1 peptidylprolyl isomerase [Roseivirga sp. E12]
MKKALFLLFVITSTACAQDKTYEVGQIKTPMGEILVWLYDEAPKHKKAFIELANEGYWDDYTFNRVIENFVAQGGCPDTPEGFAYSVHLLEPEFEAGKKHIYGAFGAGRDDNPGKLSAACQFYIVQNKDGLARLDGNYMIYGQVFKGMDVVDQIVKVEKDSSNKPSTPITLDVNVVRMTEAEISAYGFEIPKGSK